MARCSVWFALLLLPSILVRADQAWPRHAIDDSFRGADGVRLADFNRDGLQDIVTGWEESGIIRLYLNPGADKASDPWPAVTVGRTRSPEDAVPADIDLDGKMDVVSCHEGKAKKVLVHFNRAPAANDAQMLDESNWQTAEFEQLRGQAWMFASPIGLRQGRSAIVLGSKGAAGSITLLIRPPTAPQELSHWQAIRLRDAGWIMSLRVIDMDADGDQDIVFSDRKGTRRMVGWLEQPDGGDRDRWKEHVIGGQQQEVMFIDVVPGASQGMPPRIFAATRNSMWLDFQRQSDRWESQQLSNPPEVPNGKAIAVMSDRRWVMTANTHSGGVKKVSGVWFKRGESPWQAIDESKGGKFDRIELIDLNGDGLTDVLTCEERQNLGVIWYQNPGR